MRNVQIAMQTDVAQLVYKVNSTVQTQDQKGAVQRQTATHTATQTQAVTQI